jgi:hypothetical protein
VDARGDSTVQTIYRAYVTDAVSPPRCAAGWDGYAVPVRGLGTPGTSPPHVTLLSL